MSYQKHSWLNENEQGAIPINKTNLNEIETGIYNAYPIQLIAISDTAPSECNLGDKYYNSSSKQVFVATDTDTWSETGETPKSDIAYWVLSANGNYAWDGSDLVSIGGGKPQVVVSDSEPEGEPTLWIDTTQINGANSEVVNSMSGNQTALAPSVKAVKDYIDTNTNIVKLWQNANPTNVFSAQYVSISDNYTNYRFFYIVYKGYRTNDGTLASGFIPTSYAAWLQYNEGTSIHVQRSGAPDISNTRRFYFNGVSGSSTSNEFVVPIAIYGVK